MEIFAFDPFIPTKAIEKDGVKALSSAEELYKTCNYISLHIPANEKTKGSINFDLLSSMPSPAVLVNTARKEVVNEADLIKVFEARSDFGYISDIAPDNKDEIAEKFAAVSFSLLRRWEPRPPKQISMPGLQPLRRSKVSLRMEIPPSR